MKRAPQKYYCLVYVLAVASALLSSLVVNAQSILVPPPADSTVYDKSWDSLSVAQRRKLSLYGLRFAPLDPRVWGLRSVDVTESKILIPIRPFFLRASESESFRADSIEIHFEFKNVSRALMDKHPREHDPILEIGFAGVYTQPSPGALPSDDRGFAVRLSAFPAIASGFYERSRDRYADLTPCSIQTLETGRPYSAKLQFTRAGAELSLEGKVCASLARPNLHQGLLSLETSWSPVLFRKVEIRAAVLPATPRLIASGIVDTAKHKEDRREN